MFVSISISEFEAMQKVTAAELQELISSSIEPVEVNKIDFCGFKIDTSGYGGYRYYPIWQVVTNDGEFAVCGFVSNEKLEDVSIYS